MDPPNRQVRRARARFGQAREPPRHQEPDRRAVRRDARWMLPDDAESFDQIAGDANGQERDDHIPVRAPVADAGRTPYAAPEKQHAPGQEQQSKHIERELVDNVVSPLVEFERVGNARGQVVDFEQGCAEEEHHEASKQADVRHARQPPAADAGLAKAFRQQALEAWFQLAPNLPEIPGEEFAHRDGDALPPKLEPPPDAVSEDSQGQQRQTVEEDYRPVRYVAKRLAGGRHAGSNYFLSF